MNKFIFEDGCMWEGGDWKIVTDYECSEWGGGLPCKHCYGEEIKASERIWFCPSVVIATNEGGYNSTGICLQCIIEAAATLSENGVKQEYGKKPQHIPKNNTTIYSVRDCDTAEYHRP